MKMQFLLMTMNFDTVHPSPRRSSRHLLQDEVPQSPAPASADTCVSDSCYPADQPDNCPFTAYSVWDYAGLVDGSAAPGVLKLVWDSLAASRPVGMGLPEGPRLTFVSDGALQCFLRIQGGGESVTRSMLPLTDSKIFNATLDLETGVCDYNATQENFNFGTWMAQVRKDGDWQGCPRACNRRAAKGSVRLLPY